MAEIVHCYVGHNDGVTVEWLLETCRRTRPRRHG
jgi:hypothetical protein